MTFWKTPLGLLSWGLALVAAVVLGTGLVRVHQVTHPPRTDDPAPDFESIEMAVEEVVFPAADGLQLSGWLLPGEPERAEIVLCHDRAASKASLLGLMIRLHEDGFATLALDFRGHGDSEGRGTTLGLHEKRDVLGALEFLAARHDGERRPLGIYGVGMGAHAAVLAAADRAAVRVLVLDGLYPDAGWALNREVFAGWRAAARGLGFVPRSLFQLTARTSISAGRAADALPRLRGRHLLLVAPGGDTPLAGEMRRLYDTIPQTKDADGNLIMLPATPASGLYGEELQRYQARVSAFFRDRLG